MAHDGEAAEIQGHDQRSHPERGPQQAETDRPDMQDVAREDRRQQRHPGQQDDDQIQRNGAQHDLGLPDIGQAFADLLHRPQFGRIDLRLALGADQDEAGDCRQKQRHRRGVGQRHVHADDDPAQRWPRNGAGLESDRLSGDGGRQGLATHHHRQKGLAGRSKESARRAEHGGDRQQAPQGRRSVQRHHQEGARAHPLDDDGQGDGMLAVAPVGHRPGRQGEGQQRQELAQAHQPQIETGLLDRMIAPCDLIDLPQQGRGLDLDAQNRHHPAQPQQAEVANAPRTGRPVIGRRTERRARRQRRLGRNRRGGIYGFSRHVRLGVFG